MDLSTTWLGFKLPHPFIAGAGPMADTVEGARRMEDAGAAAIVMRSLFEEQIDDEALATHTATVIHAESSAEALTYFAEPQEFAIGPNEYLEQIQRTRAALSIPVIASLSGYTVGGWLEYARLMEQAGASALELNVYYIPLDPDETSAAIEQKTLDMVRQVRKAIGIPLAVKLSPFYTSAANVGRRLEEAGADGLVLFNRFYEADLDIDELEIVSRLHLSNSAELPLRLRWLVIFSGALKSASLAVTGGVHTAPDAIKAVMCGAAAVQMVSAILKNGPGHLTKIRREMSDWMEEKEYASLRQMHGSMTLEKIPNRRAFSRANYMRLLSTWEGP